MQRTAFGGFRLDQELDRHWLRWMLVFWACILTWFLVQRQGNIYWLVLSDTDDNMRLMQVRALLAGQGWYDLRQYRLDPALGGFDIHWSRIVDLPIAGLILALKPFIGTAAAERWACGIAPLLPLSIAMAGLTLTARRLIAPWAWPIALVILLGCTSTMSMYAPMRIDHHGWQLACLAMTVAGLADPRRARGGATVGISSAVSLTIGLEMLPYCAMAGAIIALRWVWDASDVRRMQAYGLTLGGGSALGFALFASNANQVMRCDALTPVWLTVMIAAGALLFGLSLLNPEKRWVRLVLAGVAGAVIAGGFAWLFPQCLGRPEQVSDELARVWLNNVREARPIYRHPFKTAFPIAVLPVIGIIGAAIATWRARRSEAVVGWAAITLFTAFAAAMLLWQIRAGPAAQLLAVPGSAALVCLLVPWFLGRPSMLVRVLGSVAAFLIVSGLFAGLILQYWPAEKGKGGTPDKVAAANAACARLSNLRVLNAIPAATLFTHVDMGPRLIVTTHHNGIAGPYHRNGRAILDVHHAFTGPTSGFRAIAAAHRAQYLLVCPDMSETTLYRARGPNGFYAQLAKGQVPNWLEPVALREVRRGTPLPFRLWKIRYELADAPIGSASSNVPHRPATSEALIPSITNCVASAASSTPSSRDTTASIFAPTSRMIGPAASSAASVSASTAAIATRTTPERSSPSFCDIISITEAIEPGPAIIGIAIGKTEMSATSSALTFSALSSRRSVRFSNTISSAIRNSMMPPAILNALRLIPSALSNASPNKAKPNRISEATNTARTAIARRCTGAAPTVSPAKIGAQPGGSITTKKVTKAETKSSII